MKNVQPMIILPVNCLFEFIEEPKITFSDSDSDEEYQIPFASSPLDECRGSCLSSSPLIQVVSRGHNDKTKTIKEKNKEKAIELTFIHSERNGDETNSKTKTNTKKQTKKRASTLFTRR